MTNLTLYSNSSFARRPIGDNRGSASYVRGISPDRSPYKPRYGLQPSQTTSFVLEMAFRALRTALYSALAIFSVILLAVCSSRTRFTNSVSGGRFYDSIVVELIVTSILALLWSLLLIFGICLAVGGCLSFLTELLGLGVLWIMFLVGAAIVTSRYRHFGRCRTFSLQCRLLSAILSWSWICFIITTFLILASIAGMIMGKHGLRSAVHGSGTRDRHRGRDAAAVGAVGAGAVAAEHHHEHKHPGYTTTSGAAAANAGDPNINTTTGTTGVTPQTGYTGTNEKYTAGPGTGTTGVDNTTGTNTGYNTRAPDYDSRDAYDGQQTAGYGGSGTGNTGYNTSATGMGTGYTGNPVGEVDDRYAKQTV